MSPNSNMRSGVRYHCDEFEDEVFVEEKPSEERNSEERDASLIKIRPQQNQHENKGQGAKVGGGSDDEFLQVNEIKEFLDTQRRNKERALQKSGVGLKLKDIELRMSEKEPEDFEVKSRISRNPQQLVSPD